MQSENQPGSKEIVSVAVTIATDNVLYKLNQTESLPVIIESLCHENNIPYNLNEYSLMLTDPINKYVTEENRSQITNGSMLRLVFSPTKMCGIIHKKIAPDSANSGEDDKRWALEKMANLSKDRTFSDEFVASYGVSVLTSVVLDEGVNQEYIVLCLETLLQFMLQGLVSNSDDLPIRKLIHFVVTDKQVLPKIIEFSLTILRKIIKSKKFSKASIEFIKIKLTAQEIIPHIWNRDNTVIQENGLAFLNALAMGPNSSSLLQQLSSKNFRDVIYTNIVMNTVSPGMAQELYVYQCLVLGLLTKKLNTIVDPAGDDAVTLQELNSLSYEQQRSKRGSIVSLLDESSMDKLQPIVFGERANSAHELQSGTPLLDKKSRKLLAQRSQSTTERSEESDGITDLGPRRYYSATSLEITRLTLDCMMYFARRYQKSYTRVLLLEERALRQPFHVTCDRLVRLLCDVLEVGQRAARDCTSFQPLVFSASNESPFLEEMFCRASLRLTKTRREMKARTPQDQEKVLKVLRHQLKETFNSQARDWKIMDGNLNSWSYERVSKAWQNEHEKTLLEQNHLSAIIELKEGLRESIVDLICQQRIKYLCDGARFLKPNPRGQKLKKKFWFICLSSNHMVFHYGDCSENEMEAADCTSKVSVSSVTDLVTGKKCPHTREAKNHRKSEPEFAFSLLLDLHLEPSSLDFIAPNQQVYDCWTDGLNALLGHKMKSRTMETDFENLLNMEVRLQLLDLEGLDIPTTAPLIPEEPPNYDFHCNTLNTVFRQPST